MSRMKWALGVSLCVNLFLIGGGISAAIVIHHQMRDFKHSPVAFDHQGLGHNLSPESWARIKTVMKTAALSGEDEMNKAHALRVQAAQLAAQDPYDATKIVGLADQARSYEGLARSKIETAMIENMAALPATERSTIAGFMLKPGLRYRRMIGKDAALPGDPPMDSSSEASR